MSKQESQDLKDTTNAITAASVFMAGLIATGSYVLADLNKFKQLITFSLGSDAESIVYKICAILFMILLLFLTASIYFWYSFSARSLQFNGQLGHCSLMVSNSNLILHVLFKIIKYLKALLITLMPFCLRDLLEGILFMRDTRAFIVELRAFMYSNMNSQSNFKRTTNSKNDQDNNNQLNI